MSKIWIFGSLAKLVLDCFIKMVDILSTVRLSEYFGATVTMVDILSIFGLSEYYM